MRLFCALVCLQLWPVSSEAADRIAVREALVVTNAANGRTLTLRANDGYTYEVLSQGDGKNSVAIYDSRGMRLQGNFEAPAPVAPAAPAVALPQPAAPKAIEATDEDVRRSLAGGVRVNQAAAGRPTAQVPGCCEVSDGEEPTRTAPAAPVVQNRSPALDPNSRIVVAPPLPQPRPQPAAAASPPRRVASESMLCRSYRGFRARGVPDRPLRQALFFLERARRENLMDTGPQYPGNRYVAIADYSQNSRQKRFYLLDLRTGEVSQEKVSHGGGQSARGALGDPNHDGMIDRCSARPGTNMSAPGFTQVGDFYMNLNQSRFRGWPLIQRSPPRNGVRLYSLADGVDRHDPVFNRGLVLHEARYNQPGNAVMGRSHGCPAFVPGRGKPVMDKLRNGGLLYTYAPRCTQEMRPVLRQVEGWERFCQ